MFFKERTESSDYNIDLYNLLIEERPKIAKYNKLKEEDVYTNKVATHLAKMRPKTKKDLNEVYGFKKENINIFGDYLLNVIKRFK